MIRKIYDYFLGPGEQEQYPEITFIPVENDRRKHENNKLLKNDSQGFQEEVIIRDIHWARALLDKCIAETEDNELARKIAEREAKLTDEERKELQINKKNI